LAPITGVGCCATGPGCTTTGGQSSASGNTVIERGCSVGAWCRPSVARMADALHTCQRSIYRALQALEGRYIVSSAR
jgi:hypothetical protein